MPAFDETTKLDQAMQDALKSVERIEKERTDGSAAAEVTVQVEEGAGYGAPPTELATENAQLREQLLRMAADFDNFRKRSRREQDEVRRFGIDRLLADVLPVLDNLDRALSHGGDSQDPIIAGIRMVAKQFHDVLAAYGVKPFPTEGKPFDPEKHEAVGQEPSSAAPAGTVLRELQRGYTIHDRLLRPARVMVAAAPGEAAP